MRNYVKKKGKNKIIEKIIDGYEETNEAIKNNAYNEKVVAHEIKKEILKKVNTINKKNMNKPINTRKLIS